MYLFDTNSVSELAVRTPHRPLVERFFAIPAQQRFISAVALQELRYGASVHPQPHLIWQKVEREILPYVRVIDFDAAGALAAGELQALLKRAGRLTGVEDLQIGATALSRNLTLVTRNIRHFEPMPGLRVENWFLEAQSS